MEPHSKLSPSFFKLGCEAVADGLEKYIDPDDGDDARMEHAPVNTDFLESTFGCLDYVNGASHRTDIWSNFGQAMAIKTGIFISVQKRIRLENERRKRCYVPEMDAKESTKFLTASPMALPDKLNPTDFEDAFKTIRKIFGSKEHTPKLACLRWKRFKRG